MLQTATEVELAVSEARAKLTEKCRLAVIPRMYIEECAKAEVEERGEIVAKRVVATQVEIHVHVETHILSFVIVREHHGIYSHGCRQVIR